MRAKSYNFVRTTEHSWRIVIIYMYIDLLLGRTFKENLFYSEVNRNAEMYHLLIEKLESKEI